METRLLQYFLAVAQEQNFSRAAEVLHTSQPNLSKQLSDLESQLGKQLFIRGSRHVTLTQEGQLLQQRAQQILSLIQQTETDVQTLQQTLSGTIRLGTEDTGSLTVLGPLMQQLHQEHPRVTFELHSGTDQELSILLQQGELDFAILSDSTGTGVDQFHSLALSEKEPLGLLMEKHHPLSSSEAISPTQLTGPDTDCSFWLTRQQLTDTRLSHWLGSTLTTLNTIATCDSLRSPAAMIAEGMGVAFCPEPLAKSLGTTAGSLTWRPLTPPVSSTRFISWNKHHTHSQAASHFLETLQQRDIQHPMP